MGGTDESFVRWHLQRPWHVARDRGARFWFDRLLPATERLLESEHVHHRTLAAQVLVIWGMIQNTQGAPCAALETLGRALTVKEPHPELVSAYYWLGHSRLETGDAEGAIAAFRRGTELGGDFTYEAEEAADPERLRKEMDWREMTSLDLAISEALMTDQAQEALRLMEGAPLDELGTDRCSAFGLALDHEAYLDEWRRIAAEGDGIYFTDQDWFFMPDRVYQRPEIWRVFLQIEQGPMFEPSFMYDGGPTLDADLPEVEGKEVGRREWVHQRYLAGIRLELARRAKDLELARSLLAQYPRFGAAEALVKRLERPRAHRKRR